MDNSSKNVIWILNICLGSFRQALGKYLDAIEF